MTTEQWSDCFNNPECKSTACYEDFIKGRDKDMSLDDFHSLCKALFCDENGKPYDLDSTKVEEMFAIFDKNKDGVIDKEEFEFCWNNWIKTILHPVSALIIVDVQNDFLLGSLALKTLTAGQEGEEVIEPINAIVDSVKFDTVVYTYDWHPDNHISFFENLHLYKLDSSSPTKAEIAEMYDTVVFEGPPLTKQVLWPKHCVENTWGAELHKDLKVIDGATKIYKGSNSLVDAYSAFWDNNHQAQTELHEHLSKLNITDVYVCGVAYDICVASTSREALELGFRTILIEDCIRGTDVEEIECRKKKISEAHAAFVDSKQVKMMVEGKDRRPELGYKLALEVNKKASSCCCEEPEV